MQALVDEFQFALIVDVTEAITGTKAGEKTGDTRIWLHTATSSGFSHARRVGTTRVYLDNLAPRPGDMAE
jgi:hypothetical protein